jgi:diadenylate cyclase
MLASKGCGGRLFTGFTLWDALDILIITVLIYQGYKLLVDSRAWNVLRGLGALLVLWLLATQFDLNATRWLFDRAAPVAFLALAVIFQPELRAALERVGQGRSRSTVTQDPVPEIMNAVRELAAQRRGALIAIEKQVPLAEYGQVVSKLGSPVSAALLQTIFDSRGPLHDGAVLIKNDVITHAGAIFPLSESLEGLAAKHGTRHRAALGLAEATDALVLVVSEERGTVSYARAGTLRADIAPAEVLRVLRETYER